eukprot:NODE_8842_length_392_cov_67.562682_g7956_i0.p1 GENE.NODE_8842_length_392_cov_67.562682_g7956_i0~~NODE_8842_length_392_cov_67.562682_g7956_i0.p1  ORF type:complete len:95 (+),score=22.80 NODE_8842_length_392_cov_67.562682_g7956_i0:28-312(+)
MGDFAQAQGLICEMKEVGARLNAITYNFLVECCVAKGQHEQAFEAFREMKARGLVPQTHVYNKLLEACAATGDTDTAEELKQEMMTIQSAASTK